MEPMIQIRHLRKEYRDVVAVRDLNLELQAGDIFGFIGPNGAGKTTTIKMLSTLLIPTSGSALIGGIDVVKNPDEVRSIVGYMPDFFGVYDEIKVWEYLDFFASAYRIPKSRRPQIIDDVLDLTDLTVKRDTYVDALSRGMKQRLCLAKTLVHDPKVLLLDEPASGLDPRARIEIKELLKELRSMGKTIIVSSHILPELADFCNKVGVIEKGEMIVAGDVGEIMRAVRGHTVIEVRIADSDPPFTDADGVQVPAPMTMRALEVLRSTPDIGEVTPVDGVLHVAYLGAPNEEWRVLKALVQEDVHVVAFGAMATDLEDVFMQVTRGIVS